MVVYRKNKVPELLRIEDFVNIHRRKLTDTQYEFPGEAHDFWEFLYVETGHLRVLVDGEIYKVSPGELVLYPPNSFHSVAISSKTVANIVCFTTASRLLYELTGRSLVLSPKAKDDLALIMELGRRLFAAAPSTLYPFNMQPVEILSDIDFQRLANLLELFLLDLCSSKSRSTGNNFKDQQFVTLTDYLKHNIGKPLTLEEISTGCSMSTSYLQKLCRKQCGCGPVTYFISLKIGAAKQMMKETALNITQISERLGFSSVHYFSKLFKSKTGMTPSEYAKSGYKSETS